MFISKAFGIYRIRCQVNGHFYIGSTIENFANRWSKHRTDLRRGRHQNPRLQRAWNKYGSSAFEFEVLEVVDDRGQMTEREQAWLDIYFGRSDCYNIMPNARRGGGEGVDYAAKTYAGFRSPGGTEYRDVRNLKAFCKTQNLNPSGMSELVAGRWKQYNGWTLIKEEPYVPKVRIFQSPDGKVHDNITDLAAFCRTHDLHPSHMAAVSNRKRRSYHGWTLPGEAPGRRPKHTYRFISPEGIVYEFDNLERFCKERGLHAASMLKVWAKYPWCHQHRGWRKQ